MPSGISNTFARFVGERWDRYERAVCSAAAGEGVKLRVVEAGALSYGTQEYDDKRVKVQLGADGVIQGFELG